MAHGQEVEGEGEHQGEKRIEAEFSFRFVATGMGHQSEIRIMIRIKKVLGRKT